VDGTRYVCAPVGFEDGAVDDADLGVIEVLLEPLWRGDFRVGVSMVPQQVGIVAQDPAEERLLANRSSARLVGGYRFSKYPSTALLMPGPGRHAACGALRERSGVVSFCAFASEHQPGRVAELDDAVAPCRERQSFPSRSTWKTEPSR
jgi:hypothetical protein